MLSLHNLRKAKGSTHRKKRLGRGNASGHGTYSTRGLKGQRARSGGRGGLVQKGVRGYLLRIPKTRGFKSRRPQPQVIALSTVAHLFNAGSVVSLKTLRNQGLISSSVQSVKIIGTGDIKKALNFKIQAVTAGAKAAIEKAGGSVELTQSKNNTVSETETKA